MSISSYRELKVWQTGLDLVEKIYGLTQSFPRQETYGLASQMQRAAVSIPSNIAEGQARDSTKEFLHYISIALGSLAELETQLILAKRLGYILPSDMDLTTSTMEEIAKMLRSLQKSLKAKIHSP